MKKIVCYSGGHSSAITAIEAVRKYGKENVILLNHDISSIVEHADIKLFKRDVADHLDLPVTYANMDGYEELTPIRVCRKVAAFQAQVGQALCTYNLKTKPFYEWLQKNYPADQDHIRNDISLMYGFEGSEMHRVQRRIGVMGMRGYQCEFPLFANKSERTIHRAEEIGIAKPITYKIFNHANCIGCLKAGRQHWYVVYCLRPDIFWEAVEAEKEIGYSIIKEVFLEELIPKFEEMKSKGICPNDRENSASFWAKVNSTLPEQMTFLPCDCAMM